MQLTERDLELFKLLSASGVCTLEQARKVYDGSKWYHYKRIDRLCKAGYLLKRGSYIELAKEGAETVGDSKYRFRHDDLRKIHSEVANIALLLGESFISSRQLRKQYGLNRRNHFKGELLLDEINEWIYEDGIYRYYHHSFKVFNVQGYTCKIIEILQDLLPKRKFDSMFIKIVTEGTGKKCDISTNANWENETRPILEAFFHALFMLNMAIKYGKELDEVGEVLPSGWAALLYLYDLR